MHSSNNYHNCWPIGAGHKEHRVASVISSAAWNSHGTCQHIKSKHGASMSPPQNMLCPPIHSIMARITTNLAHTAHKVLIAFDASSDQKRRGKNQRLFRVPNQNSSDLKSKQFLVFGWPIRCEPIGSVRVLGDHSGHTQRFTNSIKQI